MNKTNLITNFIFNGKEQSVSFVETVKVANGVECDVYTFVDDQSKDLGIIRVSPGNKTPLQKILKGDRTIEGYVSGKGKLTVVNTDGKHTVHIVGDETKEPVEITVRIGEIMQWEADMDSQLTAYEICYPPYQDGRYENMLEINQ